MKDTRNYICITTFDQIPQPSKDYMRKTLSMAILSTDKFKKWILLPTDNNDNLFFYRKN